MLTHPWLQVSVLLGGNNIPTATFFSLTVVPNTLTTTACTARGPGVSSSPNLVAGVVTSFTITSRDAYGNPSRTTTDAYTVSAQLAASGDSATTDGNPGAPTYIGTTDLSDYLAIYKPTKAGAVNLNVQLGGVHIAGSPFLVNVIATDLDPSQTTYENLNANSAAGVPIVFTIVNVDQYQNAWIDDPTRLSVDVSGPSSGAVRTASCMPKRLLLICHPLRPRSKPWV